MHASGLGLAKRPLQVVGVAIVAVIIVGQFLPFFATSDNLTNVLIQASIVAVVALGMAMVILTGGIDLSAGGVMSLVGVLEVTMISHEVPWPAAVGLGLVTGLVIGLVNGLLVARLTMPPFIATFGTLGIAAGLALYLADANTAAVMPTSFVNVGNGEVVGVPYLILIAVVAVTVVEIATRTTTWGTTLRATGDALPVAKLSGVPVARSLTSAYAVSGLTAAVAGTLLAANLSTAGPLQGEPYTLSAIAACVVGGIDLMGGRGHLWAAAAGAVFLAAVRNILNLQGVQPFTQDLVTGCLIIVAVFVTTRGPEIRSRLVRSHRTRKASLA